MRPAYKYTIENSLYVHRDHRGKGLGKILLNEIISHATSQNFHSIIAVIDASNEISLDLHRKAGFTQVGCFVKWAISLAAGSMLLFTTQSGNTRNA
jgi:phosphinothricin acetyltransferase